MILMVCRVGLVSFEAVGETTARIFWIAEGIVVAGVRDDLRLQSPTRSDSGRAQFNASQRH